MPLYKFSEKGIFKTIPKSEHVKANSFAGF